VIVLVLRYGIPGAFDLVRMLQHARMELPAAAAPLWTSAVPAIEY
jgi:hypothetical protein